MILSLAVALLLSQDGTCKTGSTCRAYGLQPPGIASASLPACGTTVKGRIMQCTNCGTGSSACMTYCNGSAWSCVATAASSPSTGWQTDGGSTYPNPSTLRVEVGGDVYADGGFISYSPSGYYAYRSVGGAYTCFDLGCLTRAFYNGSSLDFSASNGAVKLRIDGVDGRTKTITYGFDSAVDVTAVTYLRTVGVATGSLPTCNGALEGAIINDTTVHKLKYCSGSAWETITSI